MRNFRGRLPTRTVVRVVGQDPHDFLQGLFCNDLRSLSPGGSLYGCFLNITGRVIADAILMQSLKQHEGKSAIYLDVDKGSSEAVVQHLMEFKLRRKVKVDDLTGKVGLLAVRDDAQPGDSTTFASDSLAEVFPDPRSPYLRDFPATSSSSQPVRLQRVILPSEWSGTDVANPVAYDQLLMENGIYEGPSVFTSGKSLPFDSNMDMLNGVSFHKGCYLGQELTHRTHATLVVRKRTVPLVLGDDDAAPFDTTVKAEQGWGAVGGAVFSAADGTKIGSIQAVIHNKAVGLLRLRYFDTTTRKMKVRLENGNIASATIPHWWEEETVTKILGKSAEP